MRNYRIKIFIAGKELGWTAGYPDNRAALHAAFDRLENYIGETVLTKFGLTIIPQAMKGNRP